MILLVTLIPPQGLLSERCSQAIQQVETNNIQTTGCCYPRNPKAVAQILARADGVGQAQWSYAVLAAHACAFIVQQHTSRPAARRGPRHLCPRRQPAMAAFMSAARRAQLCRAANARRRTCMADVLGSASIRST